MMMGRGGGGGSKGPSALLIIGLICCFCIILPLIIYGSLWATNTICDKTKSEDQPWLGMNCASVYEGSTSPAPAPATTTGTPATTSGTPAPAPVTFPAGSTKLINSETTFNETDGDTPVANQPKGPGGVALSYGLQPVQFTISFKINSTGTDSNWWREILQNSPGVSWANGGPEQSGNSPLFFLAPSKWDGNPVSYVDKVTLRFLGSDNQPYEVRTNSPLVANQYHTITAVADTNKITIYIDGANPVTTTLPAGQTLRYRNDGGLNQNNKFVWNPNPPVPGTVVPWKIKDAYWWPKVLTATEVAAVASSTSTYMPQPLTMGTSAYVKETYMPY